VSFRGTIRGMATRKSRRSRRSNRPYSCACSQSNPTKRASLRTREGTRVKFAPSPASRSLYSRPPRVGEEGTVKPVAGPRGPMRSLRGPGGGLLYVAWDDGDFQGVAPQDLTVLSKSRGMGAACIGCLRKHHQPGELCARCKREGGARSNPAKFASIEHDTPIMPLVVADTVIEEVERYLNVTLPKRRKIADALAGRAEELYQYNADWRKKMLAKGNIGRDTLYSFMRHWLASTLQRQQPAMYRRLPASFANGEPLPGTRANPRRKTRRSRRSRR